MAMKLTEEHKEYLIALRDSGATNMWGASPYLEREFGLSRNDAKDVLLEWIKSFDKEKK
jgi:hypothetical protein